MQVDLSKAWLTFSSIVLAFAFIFGNSIRNLYEAVIFLFVVHPFDVGDVLLMGADQTWCKVGVNVLIWYQRHNLLKCLSGGVTIPRILRCHGESSTALRFLCVHLPEHTSRLQHVVISPSTFMMPACC